MIAFAASSGRIARFRICRTVVEKLIAVVLDQHIRDRSNGEKSLDDFMRDLFRNPLQESPVTTEVLLERLSSWVERKS